MEPEEMLRLECVKLAHGDIAEAKRIYDFVVNRAGIDEHCTMVGAQGGAKVAQQ